jgi:hypothetical protein
LMKLASDLEGVFDIELGHRRSRLAIQLRGAIPSAVININWSVSSWGIW